MDVASLSPAAASVNQQRQPQIKQQVAATISVAAGQSHPLTTASSSVVKPESLKAKTRPNELNDGAPQKQKHSNCKHSRCLKLFRVQVVQGFGIFPSLPIAEEDELYKWQKQEENAFNSKNALSPTKWPRPLACFNKRCFC